MHAVLYRSRARPGLVAADLNAIVGAARAYNGPAGLTGVLLYGELGWVPGAPGEFVQWIEGPDRPSPDRSGRLFPTWSMGLVRLAELPATAEGFLEAAGRWR